MRITTESSLHFSDSNGLYLPGVLVDAGQYSIAITFSLVSLSIGDAYAKLIDFKGRASDAGVYQYDGGVLTVAPFADGSGQYDIPGVLSLTRNVLVVTRDDTTGIVSVYVNGVLLVVYTDSTRAFAFDGPDNVITLFTDDTVSNVERAAGICYGVLVFDRVLSFAEVSIVGLL